MFQAAPNFRNNLQCSNGVFIKLSANYLDLIIGMEILLKILEINPLLTKIILETTQGQGLFVG